MSLKKYIKKRNFKETPEPKGGAASSKPIFVIQRHHASRLHYDFRLEANGTLKSWAVPKGPSLDPSVKRLAVEVEDHPLDYASFEGEIPKGNYGAGRVIVWDRGTWIPPQNFQNDFKKGHFEFELHGEKLHGRWALIRLRKDEKGKKNWLLLKKTDEWAKANSDIVSEMPGSVLQRKKSRRILKGKTRSPKKPLPTFISPQLAQLVDHAPSGENWLHEVKFDGYRCLCRIDKKKVQLYTRSGLDWTEKYGPLRQEILKLPVKSAIIDGEIVVIDEKGISSFQGLQTALQDRDFANMIFYAFDLLYFDGQDLRELPLGERKRILSGLLKRKASSRILFSNHWENDSRDLYKQICKLGLEGIVSKRKDLPYHEGRGADWQKSKCSLRQEFVIGGYTASNAGRQFRSLLMGVYGDDKKFRYIGKVGTGFNQNTFRELFEKMKKLEVNESPFESPPAGERGTHWVRPKLVGEVEYKSWTSEGVLRQASFKGLRLDKKPTSVRLERRLVKAQVKFNPLHLSRK